MVAKLSGTTGLEVPVPVAQTQGGTGEVASNIIVQSVRTDDGASVTGTTVLPHNDTIPQITEGDQFLSVSITPKNAANKLIIEVGVQLGHSIDQADVVIALFKDSISDALVAGTVGLGAANGTTRGALSYEIIAGTLAAITFTFRAGYNSGTTTFNGAAGSRRLGGVANSYIKVTEVTP